MRIAVLALAATLIAAAAPASAPAAERIYQVWDLSQEGRPGAPAKALVVGTVFFGRHGWALKDARCQSDRCPHYELLPLDAEGRVADAIMQAGVAGCGLTSRSDVVIRAEVKYGYRQGPPPGDAGRAGRRYGQIAPSGLRALQVVAYRLRHSHRCD